MSARLLVQIGTLFGSLSVISIGGANVLLPEIHRQVVQMDGWMSGVEFARLFAIAQAAPGPNVMFASMIGWRVAGVAGLLVATLAILVPPAIIALVAGRSIRRWRDSRAVKVLTAGLVPLALGLMLASGLVATRAAAGDLLGYAITTAVALATFTTKRNPLLWLALGMAAFVAVRGW